MFLFVFVVWFFLFFVVFFFFFFVFVVAVVFVAVGCCCCCCCCCCLKLMVDYIFRRVQVYSANEEGRRGSNLRQRSDGRIKVQVPTSVRNNNSRRGKVQKIPSK